MLALNANTVQVSASLCLQYAVLGWDLAVARFQPRPCGQLGTSPHLAHPIILLFFPLITKVFPSVTKVFPSVTRVFPSVTKVFFSVIKILSLKFGHQGLFTIHPFWHLYFWMITIWSNPPNFKWVNKQTYGMITDSVTDLLSFVSNIGLDSV